MQLARAMVFDGPSTPLRAAEFPLPVLRTGEVLAEVTMCTLCGSDIHSFRGARATACPTILGHEILGRVAQLPPGEIITDALGQEISIGDRITWTITASCGQCYWCHSGLPQKCDSVFKYGHQRITDDHPLSGGLAEFCHLAAGTTIICVPTELPDAVACPLNCATATVASAFRYAGDCADRTVLIQGAGMLGLTASAMAQTLGALHIISTDIDQSRLTMAEGFGSTTTICVANGVTDLRTHVAELTSGRGVDVAFEMSGSAAATETAIDMLRIGGRLILVGAVYSDRPVQLDAENTVRKLLHIQGVHNYTPQDLVTGLCFQQQSHANFSFSNLVQDDYRLDQAQLAFDAAVSGRACRVAVRP